MANKTSVNIGARLDRLPQSKWHVKIWLVTAFALLVCWSNGIGGAVQNILLNELHWLEPGSTLLAMWGTTYTAGQLFGALIGGLNILIEGYYQSCEEEKPAFFMATLRGAAVLIPCTLLFAPLGITYFWFLFPTTELVSLLIFLFWKKKNYTSRSLDPERIFRVTIENSNEDVKPFHDILMAENIVFLEVLKNLEQLQSDVFFMSYSPLPILGLDSCPVRAYAIEGLPGFTE